MKNIELLIEKMEQAVLAENTTSSVEGKFSPLIMPLIKKVYIDSLIPQIADFQPLTSPHGIIGALFSVYSGEGSSAETFAHPDSSYIIEVSEDISAVNVNDVWTAPDASTFSVVYADETTKTLVISRLTGVYIPEVTDTFNTGAFTITYTTLNRTAIKKLLGSYSGIIDVDGNCVGHVYGDDDNSNIRNIGFETKSVNVSTSSRKLKSKFSWEQLQDIMAVYKESGIDVASEALANEIKKEIDKEFISYLKYIAKFTILPPAKLTLGTSIAVGGGGLKDVTDDLIVNVFLAAEQIVRDTKRNRTIFVLADPITAAFLQTNALVTKAIPDEQNPYKVGYISNYPLFVDLYAEVGEYYLIVGYKGDNEGDGDSGVIYSPYTTKMHVVPSADMKENVLFIDRYAITRHPQDTGNLNKTNPWHIDNKNNSDFFKMMIIDYGSTELKNFSDKAIPNFT